jgi:glucose/mannose-6-phosphate isomerase
VPVAPATSLEQLRALARAFPTQLREGYALGEELAPLPASSGAPLLCVGVGGSAIPAELLRALLDGESDGTIWTSRGPTLPRAPGPTPLVVLTSYSGNTWETLDAYEEASRRALPRVTLSAGGELAVRAARDGVAHLRLPAGAPPRAATGWILGSLLALSDQVYARSHAEALDRSCRQLDAEMGRLTSAGGLAARLAARVGARLPTILAPSDLSALALRWATQVEENAKRLARYETFPEAMHNAIVAWEAMAPAEARRHAAIFLEPAGLAAPPFRGAGPYLSARVARRGVPVGRVPVDLLDRLTGILRAISIGDHFSLALAAAARVDPLEIRAIDRWKRASARPAHGSARQVS